ncbi:MAG: RraA family protein [Anaerolineales bacterium]|nr:RraA family protein [Anaerolineales bacterium]
MIILNERKNPYSPELIARYRKIEPATLGHLLEFGFVDPQIRPLFPPGVVVGPAFTVRTAPQDSTIVHLAIDLAQRGDVMLIDRSGDRTHAPWGGMTALAASLNGLAAVILDGVATDLSEIQEAGTPTFCRGLSAMTTTGLARDGEINTPVSIGGVAVCPGDLVIADANGILVLSPQLAEKLIDEAEARQAKSAELPDLLKGGAKISEVRGSAEKIYAALKAQG